MRDNKNKQAWHQSTIGEVVSVRNQKFQETAELPLCSLTIVDGVTPKTKRYDRKAIVSKERVKKYKLICPADIVFNPANLRWGAIAKSNLSNEVLLSPVYEVVTPDKQKVDGEFLAQLLTSPNMIRLFASRVEGTLIERMAVKLPAFLSTNIWLPNNLSEQHAAGKLLRHFDTALVKLNVLITEKLKEKRGLMQRLLTGNREFSAPGKHSIIGGSVPDGWEEVALGSIADIRYSNVDKKSAEDELSIRLCNYMDVWKNEYIFNNMTFMKATASDKEICKFQLQAGDVLLTKDSEVPEEIASTALVVTASDDLVLGYHLALIRPDSTKAIGAFISAQLEVPVFKKQLVRAACGATRFGLGIEWLKKAKVWIPGIEEQTAIADLNFKLLREIEHLQSLTSQLREQKRGLMQKLFSGELDLSELKSIATEVPA